MIDLRKIKPKKMNKKASPVDLLIWLVLSFIIVIFFATWIYGFNLITVELTTIEGDILGNNISDIAQDTFGQINPIQTKGLHTLAFVMIFSMALTILLSNFLVRSHPAFMVVYIMIIIVAIIASVYISNEYERLLTDKVLGETLQEFNAATFIMLNLPLWTTVIGIFGMIFLFSGIIRDAQQGGSIV